MWKVEGWWYAPFGTSLRGVAHSRSLPKFGCSDKVGFAALRPRRGVQAAPPSDHTPEEPDAVRLETREYKPSIATPRLTLFAELWNIGHEIGPIGLHWH